MKEKSKHSCRRRFSEEFKKQRVTEYEKGEISVSELSRLYKVSRSGVYKWLKKYSYFYTQSILIVEEKDSNSNRLKEAENRIIELERALGKKQIKVDYLEELIKIAGDRFEMDLKKTLNTKHSKDLG